MGTTGFKTAPYALHAKTAESVSTISVTTNFIPKSIDGVALGDSQIFDDVTNVGIGATNPEGGLDMNTNAANTLAMKSPRVPDYNVVTSVSGSVPIDGSMVYETTLKQLMFHIDGSWISLGKNTAGDAVEVGVIGPSFANSQVPDFVKSSKTGLLVVLVIV
tara:strand:+ start:756 stop:1238 length:483 start_codon:yes stop_codon:yes gene_type:complete